MLLDAYDEDKVAMVVTIAWSIWSNQNEVRHGGIKKNEEALVQWSSQYLAEYKSANCLLELSPMVQVVGWSPPSARYKINVDGMVFKTQKSAGVGS